MSQARKKYPLKTRVVAWIFLVAVLGGATFMAWTAIAEGRTLQLLTTIAIITTVGWGINHDAGRAKSR